MESRFKSAEDFKNDGNAAFKDGKYAKAITAYTLAINKSNGKIAKYFTNRAVAKLRAQKDSDDLESIIDDCERAKGLSTSQDLILMKAHRYCGEAQLELGRANEAYSSLVKAFRIAVREKDPSVENIRDKLMEARKARWERLEKIRIEEESTLGKKLRTLIESERDLRVQQAQGDQSKIDEANGNADDSLQSLDKLLQRSDDRSRPREVPDHFICPISLALFADPVITPSGRSYERTAIMQHLKTHPFDPLTREPLIASKIFDNICLRNACEDFLKHNDWVVDY